MKYWKNLIFIRIALISSILLQQSTVYASIDQQTQSRKHSTAHYFPNGTIYILGGIEFDLIDATQSQFVSSILTLRFDKKDFSLHSTAATTNDSLPILLPPTIGHTSHLHVPSSSLVSVFGMQQQNKESPPLIPSPSSTSAIQQNEIPTAIENSSPASRYKHASVLKNKNDLYVIGGRHTDETHQLIDPQDMIWKYSFSDRTWSNLHPISTISSMAGHATVVYGQWLISCFGEQEGGLSNSCTWFDTITFNSTKITPTASGSSIKEWPTARTYASMISLPNNSNEYVLFGGESGEETLDDIWKLHVDSEFTMGWQQIDYKNLENINYKRSGHASTLIDDMNVVLYYGGQSDDRSLLTTDPIYLDLAKMEWIQSKSMNSSSGRIIRQDGVELGNSNISENNGLSGGAIAGIIVGIIGLIALGLGFFVWRKRHQRQQHIHQQSRAARFSRSPSPMHSIALQQHRNEEKIQQSNSNASSGFQVGGGRYSRTGLADSNFLNLPELALSRHSNNRISAISLGDEFRFSADDYRRHSHQSTESAILGGNSNSSTIPKIELTNSNRGERNSNNSSGKSANYQLNPLYEDDNNTSPTATNSKKRESTGFKRLTLNLFSGASSSQQQDHQGTSKKKDRSSSLFQLRSSRLLQPGTPNTPGTPDGRFPLSPKGIGLQSRVSLGAKSVASVQWVGFNDNMDYNGNNWRDSSGSSMHLAVVNAQRASSYYTSDSAQSTPRSPRFPSHLRDSTAHYQVNENEANSSKLELTKSSSPTPEDFGK
jgi:hypothetical protein